MPRRNVRKLALRPPLPRRGIVWFPAFPTAPATSNIEAFRAQHDPLAAKIPAHLTLVFPFPCTLTATQIASHTRRIVAKWPPLPVVFRDVEGLLDEFILLMARERAEALTALHDELYTGVLRNFLRTEMTYNPHITIARVYSHSDSHSQSRFLSNSNSRESFHKILEQAESCFGNGRGIEWRIVMRELAVVTWHTDGKITVDATIPLNTN